jgi:hypothetical protein
MSSGACARLRPSREGGNQSEHRLAWHAARQPDPHAHAEARALVRVIRSH